MPDNEKPRSDVLLADWSTDIGGRDVLGLEPATDPTDTDFKNTVGPERFLRSLLDGYDPRLHGEVKLHFMSFSGIAPTAQWIAQWVNELDDR